MIFLLGRRGVFQGVSARHDVALGLKVSWTLSGVLVG
jgi:hypothetical protein